MDPPIDDYGNGHTFNRRGRSRPGLPAGRQQGPARFLEPDLDVFRVASRTPSTGYAVSGQAPLALDVAILLPAALRQYLSRLNAELAPPPVGFHFDDTHLPHVSLAQIFVRAADLDDAIAETERTLHEVRPLTLQMAQLSQGGTTSVIRVSSTPALLTLHTALMDRLRAFEVAPGDPEAFVVDREAPRPDDVRWVEQFRDAAAYDNFDPHITLGVGRSPP